MSRSAARYRDMRAGGQDRCVQVALGRMATV